MQIIVEQDYRRLDGSIADVGETLEEVDAFALALIGANKVRPVDPGDLIPPQPAEGVTAFTQLTDVPNSYVGAGDKWLKVKASMDGMEFASPTEDPGAVAFTELTDVPQSYAGQSGKVAKVNATEDGLEFVEGGASAFTELSDAPETIVPRGVVVGNNAGDALVMTDLITIGGGGNAVLISAGNVTLRGSDDVGGVTNIFGGSGEDVDGGIVVVRGGAATGVGVNGGDVSVQGGISGAGTQGAINLGGSALRINGNPAIATQSVFIPSVGTLEFTHGMLMSFTPE